MRPLLMFAKRPRTLIGTARTRSGQASVGRCWAGARGLLFGALFSGCQPSWRRSRHRDSWRRSRQRDSWRRSRQRSAFAHHAAGRMVLEVFGVPKLPKIDPEVPIPPIPRRSHPVRPHPIPPPVCSTRSAAMASCRRDARLFVCTAAAKPSNVAMRRKLRGCLWSVCCMPSTRPPARTRQTDCKRAGVPRRSSLSRHLS